MGAHSKVEAATQERYPWRTVARTVFQLAPGVAVLIPVLVQTSGVEPATAGVAAALAVSAAVTRTMASPAVNEFIARWAPWLAAEPAR